MITSTKMQETIITSLTGEGQCPKCGTKLRVKLRHKLRWPQTEFDAIWSAIDKFFRVLR